MNRRFASASIAMLLTIAAPAGAARAAESATAQSTAPVPAPPPPPAGSSTTPPQPVPFAEAKITQAEAEAAVTTLFKLPQPSEKVELQWNLSQYGNRLTWELQVNIQETDGSGSGFGLASVDAVTGRVLRYGGYNMIAEPIRTGPLGAPHGMDEARARAWALVQKAAPEKADLLRPAPGGSPNQFEQYYYYGYGAANTGDIYNFTWIEYHDGVPFPASSVSVAVDKQSLDYVNMNVNLLDAISFQAGPAKLTAEAALQFWQAEAKPSLAYQPVQQSNPYGMAQPRGYKLVYSLGNLNRQVDAMTGTWVGNASPYPSPPAAAKPAGEPETVPSGSVTPVLPKALPLSDSDAQSLATAVLEPPQGAALRSNNDMFSEERLIQFHLFGQGNSGSIALDPKSGLIRNAYRYFNTQPMQPGASKDDSAAAKPVTPEQEAQAKQAAFAVVQTYYSQIREQLRLDPLPPFGGPQDSQVRRFRFTRYVNGLDVPNESVYVTIDLATMKWRDMNASWTNGVSFPSPGAAIAAEKAQETAMADRKPMLVYRPVYPAINKEQAVKGPAPQPTEAALAYTLTPGIAPQVDALTGQAVGYDVVPASEVEAAYQRVTGHWAEGELRFALSRQLLSPVQLKPEAPLTRAQAVAMLLVRSQHLSRIGTPAAALPYNDLSDSDPAYGAVRMAWSEGWLRPVDADKAFRASDVVSRVDFAVWAARALGLGDLARTQLRVDAGYKDLDGMPLEQRNAISFLRALGLLPAEDSFRPTQAMTQAEGAALTVRIYNYLLTH
jgi:hypothetical protein